MSRPPTALSVAGSDPSGGAGVQADLKTFAAHGVYGMAALTALTAQNTRGVVGVHGVPPGFVAAQIAAVLADIRPDAVKIGMLGAAPVVAAVADALADYDGPVVLDPVLVATSGARLLEPAAERALLDRLAPRAALLTPNLPEAAALLGEEAPDAFARRTGVAVLLKDGHGDGEVVRDRLFLPDGRGRAWALPRVATRNTHGTGCTLSSAIAANLACGAGIEAAVDAAVSWLAGRVAASADHDLGGGHGPLLHVRPARPWGR